MGARPAPTPTSLASTRSPANEGTRQRSGSGRTGHATPGGPRTLVRRSVPRWLGVVPWGVVAACAVGALASVETLQALIAPTLAPTPADWQAAARHVRASFHPGDLMVAAPGWADPLLRLHLGDLLPIAVAARMDDARFGRVWEISQRGARARSDGDGSGEGPMRGTVTETSRWGALTVRLVERPPAIVTFDLLERWQDAIVVTAPRDARRAVLPCPWRADRFACPSGTTVHRELVEVDTRIRRALLAPPPSEDAGALRVELAAVRLGRELVVGAGLHDLWARKLATGVVHLETWIDGAPVNEAEIGNRSGWRLIHIDTRARAGQLANVRFEISSARPALRHFAFAAEARL